MNKHFSKRVAFQTKGIVLISFLLMFCITGCDFLSSKEAVRKYINKIRQDSVLLNEFIYLSYKIEVDTITYTIRPTRGGSVYVEEDKDGGRFLNNENLNSDKYKRSLYLNMSIIDASYIVFENKNKVIFGFSERNCGLNYFELIYLKDTTNYIKYFKNVSVYEGIDSLPKQCNNWIYRLDERWLLYSE